MNPIQGSFSIFFLGSLLSVGVALLGEVLFATFFLVFTFLVCSVGVIKARRADILQLDLIFCAFLIIYSVAVPMSNALSSNGSVGKVELSGFVLCLVGCMGYSTGCLFGKSARSWISGTRQKIIVDYKSCRRTGYFIYFGSVFFSIVAVASTVGLSAYANAGYAGRSLLKREAGPIELGLYSAVIGLILILASYLTDKKSRKIDLVFFGLSTLFFVAYVSTLGIRRPTFLLLLATLACVAILRRKIGLVKSFVIGVPLFLLFATFAQYRQVLSDAGLVEAIAFISSNFSTDWFNVADTELGAPFRTLTDTLSRYGDFELFLGKSYMLTPVYVLPSAVTGGVESLSMIYTREFFSDRFIAIGGNMGYFPVTEAYINFGRVGVFLVFAGLALLVSNVNHMLYIRPNPSIVFIVLCCLAVPWMAFFMRLDLASFAKGFFYSQVVPMLVASYLYKNVFSR